MPLGFERLNERSLRPNALINFIKPLDGPDKAIAEDYLNRIAAQCYPVMKAAHVSVMALEEFPPNNEFLGRNFNAGECIQLVLKDKSGQWLGFKYVQMVMMHELAHCKQMNHSKYFWQVRNEYAAEMYKLWERKYLGEGVWGRGQNLASGRFVMDRDVDPSKVPEHLCGGTYRRRGRKRKRGGQASNGDVQKPTYAERQQRRIAKKFGKHGEGNALGEDEFVRDALEASHRHQGKPRVAGSKRGRELRAQAALARFEATKVEQSRAASVAASTDDDSDIEWSDSETEDEMPADENGFVKICDGEDDVGADDARNEMSELQAISDKKHNFPGTIHSDKALIGSNRGESVSPTKELQLLGSTDEAGLRSDSLANSRSRHDMPTVRRTDQGKGVAASSRQDNFDTQAGEKDVEGRLANNNAGVQVAPVSGSCPVCSLENEVGSLLCMACGHVLRPKLVTGSWRCRNNACGGGLYLNAGDAGRCGICGATKPATPNLALVGRPVSADILRWD